MAPSSEAKFYGLRLTLPGAPNTPHMVAGLPGWYWPDKPTPVGGFGEPRLEHAKKLAADSRYHVELVPMTRDEVDRRRGELKAHGKAHRSAIAKFRPATPQEADRKKAEIAATKTDDKKEG